MGHQQVSMKSSSPTAELRLNVTQMKATENKGPTGSSSELSTNEKGFKANT
jgi:hypothetical protein